MPTVTLNAEVWKPASAGAQVYKPAAADAVMRVVASRATAPPGVYYMPVTVPAGAIQAEDDTYLLTEDSNYIEAE